MPAEARKEPCPECGKLVSVREEVCPFCDAELFEDDDDQGPPRRPRRKSSDVEAVDLIVPTNVSVWSILSCYMGLIGFCLPVVGLVFAIPAVVFGIMGLRRRKKTGTYGAVTSDIRAIIGLVLGGLGTLIGIGLLILMIATGAFKK
jgi:hypothetical protein